MDSPNNDFRGRQSASVRLRYDGGFTMHELWFDQWTRLFVSFSSRRATVRALAGGAIGGMLGRLLQAEAAAECVKLGKRCEVRDGKKRRCCGGAKCRGKKCRCAGGKRACNGECVDAACCTDDDCDAGGACRGGVCVGGGACPNGQYQCLDTCCELELQCEVGDGSGACAACPDGYDFCSGGPDTPCGPCCACSTSVGGQVICAEVTALGGGECNCINDDECPAGTACILGGPLCNCTDPQRGSCVPIGCSGDCAGQDRNR